MIPSELMVSLLDTFKQESPDQILIVETPEGSVSLRIGDALIYEDGYGRVVVDSE